VLPVLGIGATDIIAATSDSVVIRAQRGIGFVCGVTTSDKHATTWSLSGTPPFSDETALLIFADGDVTSSADDHWVAARVNSAQNSTASCPGRPGNPVAQQRLNLKALDGTDLLEQVLANVRPGAPIRSVERVTYGLYPGPGTNSWFLGRRRGATAPVDTLVAGLAAPGQGVVFTYLNAQGAPLIQPVIPAQVAAIHVTASTSPPSGSGAKAVSHTTRIHLRNN
jgi:hypothetical protein